MKRMSMALISAALSLVLLTGCFGSNWEMGENIIGDDGSISFFNGVDIGFAGVVETIADAEVIDANGIRAYNSTYAVTTEDGQFAFVASQVSSARTIMNVFGRTVSDSDYEAMVRAMTDSMVSDITQSVPGSTVSEPVITREQITTDSGNTFDVGEIVYSMSGGGQNLEMKVTTIIDRHSIIMILTMRDGSPAGEAIADAVEQSIRFR